MTTPDPRDRLIQELSDSLEFVLEENARLRDHVHDLGAQLDIATLMASNADAAANELREAVRAMQGAGWAS